MANNVPATALSPNQYNGGAPQLVIGSNWVTPPTISGPGYWYVVADLGNNLNVVANEFSSDNTNPPANVAAMLGNPSYFLFFVGMSPITGMMPQGALAQFLQKAGSGPQLGSLEQTISQLGTGYLATFSYVLAATLNNQDVPGFEVSSLWDPSILTMQFMPITVDGKTVYAPVQQGTAVAGGEAAAAHTPPLPTPR